MIYIRKIFKQDLRDGKQIAFPSDPSDVFFQFNFRKPDKDRKISFKFIEKNVNGNLFIYNNKVINTRLYSAGGESRIDGELKRFLIDNLNAKEKDILIFKKKDHYKYEFEFAPIGSSLYNALIYLIDGNHLVAVEHNDVEIKSMQCIYYGAPGTGKSYKIKKKTEGKKKNVTTFHPDSDYSTFVGSYKPQMDESKNITYKFTPQVFAKAYVEAWSNLDEPNYLVIEEINRGNCAQIFGDIFQLLDRKVNGFSEYVIDVDKDFADYVEEKLNNNQEYAAKIKELCVGGTEFSYSKIALPSNLYIYATMNTSDQSLFPMDSAFKRRWDWEYIPIDYDQASEIIIKIDSSLYSWKDFLEIINPKIKQLTNSEDKQLGNRFVNPHDGIITFDNFRSKVLFYLWFEVYKDEAGTNTTIFKSKKEVEQNNKEEIEFSFGDLFNEDSQDIINGFMKYIGLSVLEQIDASQEEILMVDEGEIVEEVQ